LPLVSFGNASGAVEGVNLGTLTQKGSVYITRPSLFHYANNAQNLREMAAELFELMASGQIKAHIGACYPLKEAAKAQEELANRKTQGSSILLP